jgi:5'-nucleotidase
MRELSFLVTNDDGIDSPLLAALVAALLAHGRVTVAAPRAEQSWIGKAISRHRELHVRAIEARFGCPAWEIDGTPADCVNLALGNLVPACPDMVVSGINMGSNAGLPLILASGTIGGATEGAFHGLHALATSIRITKDDFARAKTPGGGLSETVATAVRVVARRSAELCETIARKPRSKKFLVHNLNFPPDTTEATPLVPTVPAAMHIGTLFRPAVVGKEKSGAYAFTFSVGDEIPAGLRTDRATLESGSASHSLIDFGRLGLASGAHGEVSKKGQNTEVTD